MAETQLTIKQWDKDDQPREKMLKYGIQKLSDAELLAILLRAGTKEQNVVELARSILHDSNNNIDQLAQLSVKELCKKYKGIGQTKAITIIAALEFGKRRKKDELPERRQILNSRDLFDIFEPQLIDLQQEEFWIVLLNRANRLIDVKQLTVGGQSQTLVDVKLTLRTALENNAAAVAVAHNHPSGQVFPSLQDENITRQLSAGFAAVDIHFIDHLIICCGKYYSFADEGKLP